MSPGERAEVEEATRLLAEATAAFELSFELSQRKVRLLEIDNLALAANLEDVKTKRDAAAKECFRQTDEINALKETNAQIARALAETKPATDGGYLKATDLDRPQLEERTTIALEAIAGHLRKLANKHGSV